MRAYVVEQAQGAFREVDLPCPVPGPGQVLVRVHASGVNPLDTKIRGGKAAHAKQPLPAVLGLDMAGGGGEGGGGGGDGGAGEEGEWRGGGGGGGVEGTLAEFVVANADLFALQPKSI